MKAVMISIKPKQCFLIASKEQTIIVRKTRPKIEVPFKCYIYETKAKLSGEIDFYKDEFLDIKMRNEQVIGEFVCDKIYDITTPADYWSEYLFFAHHNKNIYDSQDLIANELLKETCLSMQNIIDYSQGKPLYGWHISDLKIYDKPKELSDFEKFVDCYNMPYTHCPLSYMDNDFMLNCDKTIKKPPQSWCYVEVDNDNQR